MHVIWNAGQGQAVPRFKVQMHETQDVRNYFPIRFNHLGRDVVEDVEVEAVCTAYAEAWRGGLVGDMGCSVQCRASGPGRSSWLWINMN